MNKQPVCNNCNKCGHFFHQCRLPITSYGIIVYRRNIHTGNTEFLMICRKDSFGFTDFVRGKYQLHSDEKIQQLINEMSMGEKHKIVSTPFQQLWQQLWVGTTSRTDESSSSRKFEFLTSELPQLISNSTTCWEDAEWEFPKGRRNYHEKDLDCALREFEEETGYRRSDVSIVENIVPYDEIFIGSNNKSYKHKYFIACMNNWSDKIPSHQTSEVSKTEWKTLDDCLNSIRPNSLEKKTIISNVANVISNFVMQ